MPRLIGGAAIGVATVPGMQRRRSFWIVGSIGAALTSTPGAATAQGVTAQDVTVNPIATQQTIDGFGASSAWTTQNASDSEADLLFSGTNPDGGASGIGLSLLRIRVSPEDGMSLEIATAQKAQARGAKVWATPWSPPSEWKDGTDDAGNGGTLDHGHYADWAGRLVQFLQNMQAAHIDIVALSAQNEPTKAAVNTAAVGTRPPGVGYESCLYTPPQLADFIGNFLGPALDDAGVTPALKIMAPETQNWAVSEFADYANPLLADPDASPYIGTIATHDYNDSVTPSPYAVGARRYWETEVSQLSGPLDPTMTSALWMAGRMHDALVVAGVNAWHFWWITPAGPDNSGLYTFSDAGLQPSKRLWVMGNFSRFVRPGFSRVATSPANQFVSADAGGGEVLVSAYCDSATCDGSSAHQLVVVAINNLTTAVPQKFQFSGVTTGSWQSWVTSNALDLSPGDAVTGTTSVTYTLAPQSVTTLVGEIVGPGPDAGADTVAPTDDAGAGAAPLGNDGCGLACSTVGRVSDAEGEAGAIGASALVALAGALRMRSRRAKRRPRRD